MHIHLSVKLGTGPVPTEKGVAHLSLQASIRTAPKSTGSPGVSCRHTFSTAEMCMGSAVPGLSPPDRQHIYSWLIWSYCWLGSSSSRVKPQLVVLGNLNGYFLSFVPNNFWISSGTEFACHVKLETVARNTQDHIFQTPGQPGGSPAPSHLV